ncbi:hypothetical protein RJT34_02818 [Clitoria ternatea]|uniref:Uncharacterized protein n=1 Tax=Clitoria ternatea TaxID=43366 RepID=A0AAN9KI99_CLITE
MATAINLPFVSLCKTHKFLNPSSSPSFLQHLDYGCSLRRKGRGIVVCVLPLAVDAWAPTIDSQSIAPQLFAFSLFPYIAFLYFITKSKTCPNLTLFGFYFLLAFVGATTKVHYGTSLSNVDWLHGGAESLLTLTNLFIVLGLREGLRKTGNSDQSGNTSTPKSGLDLEEKEKEKERGIQI